jgi:parvulin-like peptidyl-prolyl isomerase
MKRVQILAIFAIYALNTGHLFAAKLPSSKPLMSEKIEVRVGQDVILTTDLNLMIETVRSEYPDLSTTNLRKKAVETLINQSLMGQYLHQIQMGISSREVDKRIDAIIKSQGIKSHLQFSAILQQQGMSYEQFRTKLKQQMEQMQFMAIMRRQLLHTFDENELKAYYQTNKKKFSSNYELELAECVIAYGDDPKKSEEKAFWYIDNPNKFKHCVQKWSVSASKAQNGGIGTFRQGMLREDVQTAVFKLKKGQTTVVRSPAGFQVLKVLNKKDLGPQKFEDVKAQIQTQLESDLLNKALVKTLSDLRAKTFIQIKS